MKKYKVKITPDALDDIINISNYIFEISKDKEISLKIFDLLISNCNGLNLFPNIYQILFDNIRRKVIKPYSLFYEIFENKKEVVIYRVLGNTQDYFKINFK